MIAGLFFLVGIEALTYWALFSIGLDTVAWSLIALQVFATVAVLGTRPRR